MISVPPYHLPSFPLDFHARLYHAPHKPMTNRSCDSSHTKQRATKARWIKDGSVGHASAASGSGHLVQATLASSAKGLNDRLRASPPFELLSQQKTIHSHFNIGSMIIGGHLPSGESDRSGKLARAHLFQSLGSWGGQSISNVSMRTVRRRLKQKLMSPTGPIRALQSRGPPTICA